MTRALFDINVLVALLDSDHVDHGRAHAWLDDNAGTGWASCAITENGFVRVISQPTYPSPVAPARAVDVLARACRGGDHQFWACDVSLLETSVVNATVLYGPRQVTDAYLLALAVHHGGRFVTFDRLVALSAVHRASPKHLVIL